MTPSATPHAWKTRLLAFGLTALGMAALAACSPSETTPDADPSTSVTTGSVSNTAPEPGEYTIAVTLTGGSGRATIESPATLTVTADEMTATVVWSSSNYTWMKAGGVQYDVTSAAGENSTFEIPVTLDEDMAISAETVAMGSPKEVEYTLRFDSSTLKEA